MPLKSFLFIKLRPTPNAVGFFHVLFSHARHFNWTVSQLEKKYPDKAIGLLCGLLLFFLASGGSEDAALVLLEHVIAIPVAAARAHPRPERRRGCPCRSALCCRRTGGREGRGQWGAREGGQRQLTSGASSTASARTGGCGGMKP